MWGSMNTCRLARAQCGSRIALAALGACLALLVTIAGARAWNDPASYVRPPLPWHRIPADQAPVQLDGAVPITAVFVNDAWTSRYQVEIDVAGGLIRYEKPRYPYSADISLKRAFYQVYGHDNVLAGHGITPGIGDANLVTLDGRPTAYLAWQGTDATCFAFVSQFSSRPDSGRDRMLNGSVCRPKGDVDPDALTHQWLALLERMVVR